MLRKHKFFLILRPRDQTKLHIPSHIQILSQEVRRYTPRLPSPWSKWPLLTMLTMSLHHLYSRQIMAPHSRIPARNS